MYEEFFGLRNRPFSPLPRVDSYIPLAPVREPLETLIRCIEQERGIGVLTAPSGAGKSLICRLLYSHFREARRTVLLTSARFPTRRALLQAILFELKHPYIGLSEQEARLKVLDLLQASSSPVNRMLLIVDEAHLLTPRGLEELRTLTDYEIGGQTCISLVLSGQLELEELLTEPAMNALNQRVGGHVCIEPFTFEESTQYIRERLRIAGSDGLRIFSPDAIHLICSASEGNPRRINQLCDHSLLLAYAEEVQSVDESVVRSALLDLRELPLHWNAPLDLADPADRNPLKSFADRYERDSAISDDDATSYGESEFDSAEDSAFEPDSSSVHPQSAASVFEVGSSLSGLSALPAAQFFQQKNFAVPQDSLISEEPGDSLESTETHTFETGPSDQIRPPRGVEEGELREAALDDGVDPRRPTESDLQHPWSAPAAVRSRESEANMEFEELLVDDIYAVIDRRSESMAAPSTSATAVWISPNPARDIQPLAIPDAAPCMLHEVEEENLDETCLDDSDIVPHQGISGGQVAEVVEVFESPIVELPPVILESQLLQFIHEISVDVQQFRNELGGTRPADESVSPLASESGEVTVPRHQSLRKAWNAQFDVVEPEPSVSQDNQSSSPEVLTQEIEPQTRAPEPVISGSPIDDRDHAPDGRPYSQLFTRLQRQRRRVEQVMERERRLKSEFR